MEKRVHQQIRTVERLLQVYRSSPGEPLARFLTGFYKRNRQMGSSDRRMASRLAYNYFRIGKALETVDFEVRLAAAEFLCSADSAIVQSLFPQLYPYHAAPVSEKVNLLEKHVGFHLDDVFPYANYLSDSIERNAFLLSLFEQPDLFIRLRRGNQKEVLQVLDREGITYQQLSEFTVGLPNGTALHRIPAIAGKYEVQDFSSQQTVNYFEAAKGEKWWDACSGSGGKSLLLLDRHPGVDLLVSDTRSSILRNLDERFETAGIKSYRKKIIDLTKDINIILQGEQFDGIILDAPCTGSGTWGRTPEMITWFEGSNIDRFATLQKQLASHVLEHLEPGRPLVYITCSVFAAENEEVVRYLQTQYGVKVDRMELLHGYRHRSDSMFVARLIK